MENRIIKYDMIQSYLADEKKYRGIIHHPRKVNSKDLIDEIVSSNTTVTRQDALAVIDLYEHLIKEHLNKGHTVTTGLFRADISLTGFFDSKYEKINYKKHKAKIVIRPANKLSEQICRELRFHRRSKSRRGPFLSRVGSRAKDLPDGSIPSGRIIYLYGEGLKSYKHENEYDLILKGGEGKRYSLPIETASIKKITSLVPHNIPPGSYSLLLVHRYGQINRKFRELPVVVVL